MERDLLALVEEARALNPDVFSLIRLQLLLNLANLWPEAVTYRELKASLQLSDGALYSNLKVLEGMGYVASGEVTLEERELKSYQITAEGKAAWEQVKAWLLRFLECGGERK